MVGNRVARVAVPAAAAVLAALLVVVLLLPSHPGRHVHGLLVVVALALVAGIGGAVIRVAVGTARTRPPGEPVP